MPLRVWIRLLRLIGWVLGAAVVLYGLSIYVASRRLPALLIALAVVVAGPLEDLLTNLVRRRTQSVPEDPWVQVVDLATSAVFLALLLWAQVLIGRGA